MILQIKESKLLKCKIHLKVLKEEIQLKNQHWNKIKFS